MTNLSYFLTLPMMAAIFSGLLMFGLMFYFWQSRNESNARSEVRKRLDISKSSSFINRENKAAALDSANKVAANVAAKATKFYSEKDPVQKRTMENRLIQAGYSHKYALGFFFAARFAFATLGVIIGLGLVLTTFSDMAIAKKAIVIILMLTLGYFFPNFHINGKVKSRQLQNRLGFPDVMDLMVVSAEAGLTTEASIARIAREIVKTYPVLSEQLELAAVEIRAGRPLHEALNAFGVRVGLEEVKGFATMIQQSKELGTSVSDALRVYSDEMRYKRMMAAEEKAYALPAKLSIPVTAFILPIVVGVAVIPAAVRLTTGL